MTDTESLAALRDPRGWNDFCNLWCQGSYHVVLKCPRCGKSLWPRESRFLLIKCMFLICDSHKGCHRRYFRHHITVELADAIWPSDAPRNWREIVAEAVKGVGE